MADAKRLTIGSTVIGVGNVARAREFYMAALDYVPTKVPDDTWGILVPREGPGAQIALALSESPVEHRPRGHRRQPVLRERASVMTAVSSCSALRRASR